MDSAKNTMCFACMGTVVYLFRTLDAKFMVPTLALMFALWASCWWIGRVPITASGRQKFVGWAIAAAFSLLVGWMSFGYQPNRQHELPWEEFSLAALDEHVKAHRTVMIDFTARWCLTCKALERSVLNTAPVRQLVEKNDVVTLVADWSDGDEEVSAMLNALGSSQVPVIAIFPAEDPYRPKKLAGAYTRGTLLQKLNEAGPSQSPRLADDAVRTVHPTPTATPVARAASGSTIMPSTASDCHIAIGATPQQCAATLLARMVVTVSHWVQSHPIEVLMRWLLGFLSSFGTGVLSQ